MRRRLLPPDLTAVCNDPTIAPLLDALVIACCRAHDNVEDSLVVEHGAHRGVFGYVAHAYRLHEIVDLPAKALRHFNVVLHENRVTLWREDLRMEVMGLGKKPTPDPMSWMPQNQNGWPPTEQQQMELVSEDEGPVLNRVVFLCCLPDERGDLISIELRIPRINEHGQLFAWHDDVVELWRRDPSAQSTPDVPVEVAVKRSKSTLVKTDQEKPDQEKPKAKPKAKKKTRDDAKE